MRLLPSSTSRLIPVVFGAAGADGRRAALEAGAEEAGHTATLAPAEDGDPGG
jgi:hypothetical protein